MGISQPENGIELPRATVTAGDQIEVKVTLQTPTECFRRVVVNFREPRTQVVFQVYGNVEAGGRAVTLEGTIPRDMPAGDYQSSQVILFPCPDYELDTNLAVPPRTFSVRAFPNPVAQPGKADLELSLTQKQLLDTKIAEISDLENKMNSRLEEGHTDLPELRGFLAETVNSAEDDLAETASQYRKSVLKPGEPLPEFFGDLHAQYQSLLISINSPIPGTAASSTEGPLVLAQLKTRPPGGRLADTWPPIAEAVWNALKDHIGAFTFVKEHGTASFTTSIISYPPKANISYRRWIDDEKDYVDYSDQTNVAKATFVLQRLIFKFHLEGCKDEIKRIDPYQEDATKISVEFVHCKPR